MLPKVVDLFSGCGGLALGFQKAGFDIASGIELMPEAVKTINYNLSYRYDKEAKHICGDITQMNPDSIKINIGQEGCIVIGGPPCQAYSIAGRGKLRSLGEDRIHTKDARGYLYQDYLRFIYGLDARAVVMENVPESTNFGEKNIPEEVSESLKEHGYSVFWTVLNAANYGVPQLRERVILMGIKKNEGRSIELPMPTNINRLDTVGNYGNRIHNFEQCKYYCMPPMPIGNEPQWVTVGDAFSDLPVLFPTADSKYKPISLNIEYQYKSDPRNEYQIIMRNWFGEPTMAVSGNSFRKNSRDFQIFERMEQGDNYIRASEIADQLFEEALELYQFEFGTNEYEKLHKSIVPVYDRNSFESKWRKLDEDKPSHTLVAHLAKDTYSHIHPTEPRGISVREAARLQSFPDDFYFDCGMSDAYKQIGNAVPPLFAYAIAKAVKKAFEEEENGIIE